MVKIRNKSHCIAASILLASCFFTNIPAVANGLENTENSAPLVSANPPSTDPVNHAPGEDPGYAPHVQPGTTTTQPSAQASYAAPVAANAYVPPVAASNSYVPPATSDPYVPPAVAIAPAAYAPTTYSAPVGYVPYGQSQPPASKLNSAASTLETVLRVVNTLGMISGAVKAFN